MGIGNRYRAALFYLFFENGYDTSVTSKDITKTHRRKFRRAFLRQGLHINLRNPFTGPHDIRGIDRFVGGNHNEILDAESVRRISKYPGPANIVGDRL